MTVPVAFYLAKVVSYHMTGQACQLLLLLLLLDEAECGAGSAATSLLPPASVQRL